MGSCRRVTPWLLAPVLALSVGAPWARAEPVPGAFPEASSRLLTAADLAGKSPDVLSKMRNEVFARHGHRFKSPALARHFEGEPWYRPQVDDAGPLLTEMERKNVALIRQVEKQAKEAARIKEEAEARAAWEALPPDVQSFWKRFRDALKSGDPARLGAFIAGGFRDGLGPMLREGRSRRVGRAAFTGNVAEYLPDSVIERMRKQPPAYEKGVLRFYTGELEEDEYSRAGRIYRFQGSAGRYQLSGVYIAAGPGDEG
jgi:hypothetical protein